MVLFEDMPKNVLSDEALLSRYKDREDQDALRILLERYEGRLRAFLRRQVNNATEADDLCQDIFTFVITKKNFRGNFRSWLFGTAIKLSFSRRRSFARRRKRELVFRNALPDIGKSDPCQDVVLAEQYDALNRALADLPDKFRLALELHYLHSLSINDTAKTMQVSLKVVEWRLEHGRDLLRKKMKKMGFETAFPAAFLALQTFPKKTDSTFVRETISYIQNAQFNAKNVQKALNIKNWKTTKKTFVTWFAFSFAFIIIITWALWLYSTTDNMKAIDNSHRSFGFHWAAINGMPKNCLFFNSRYTWRKPENGEPGGLVGQPQKPLCLALPQTLADRSWRIQVKARRILPLEYYFEPCLFSGNQCRTVRIWNPKKATAEKADNFLTFQWYQTDRFFIFDYPEELDHYGNFEYTSPADRLGFRFDNLLIEEMTIQQCPDTELPARLKNKALDDSKDWFCQEAEQLSPAILTPVASKPFHYNWTFSKGIPEGVQLKAGNAKLEALQDSQIQGLASNQSNCLLLLEPQIQSENILVEFKFQYRGAKNNASFTFVWADENQTIASIRYKREETFFVNPNQSASFKVYVVGRYFVTTHNGQIQSISDRILPNASDHLALVFTNILIESISMRNLTNDEIPDSIKKIHELKKAPAVVEFIPSTPFGALNK